MPTSMQKHLCSALRAREIFSGVDELGENALPVISMERGLPGALSITVSTPPFDPGVFGLKVTSTEILEPAFTCVGLIF